MSTTMTNIERLKLEIQDSGFTDIELSIFLEENSLSPLETYNPSSNQSKRAIYQSALTVLEAIANNPELMADRKFDDTSVLDFADSLQNRIDQLERKIRKLPTSDTPQDNSNTFMLFGR